MSILWRDSMQIGDEWLDAEHKRFIALLNLAERSLNQKDVAPIGEIFDELQSYVETHFAHEEAYMAKVGYPEIQDHKKLHEELSVRFFTLQGRYRAAQTDAERRRHATKLAEFLREWLIDHILKEVVDLKAYVPAPAPPDKPQTTPWLASRLAKNSDDTATWPTLAPAPTPSPTPAPTVQPGPAAGGAKGHGEWKTVGVIPPHLQKFVEPLEYTVPRPPAPKLEFASFEQLAESAIWRSVNKILLFFQRHNANVVRELPPLFIASPEFARNLKRALDTFVFPVMWQTRRLKMLMTNFGSAVTDDDTFFDKLGERNPEHILAVWGQIWNGLRLIEAGQESGYNLVKVKDNTKYLREILQPSTPLAYDMPKVGNREIEVFKALLDPRHDWSAQFNRRWRVLHDYYVQEKTMLGDPDIREGTLRDHLIEMFNYVPEPWGDFMILTAHRVFPRLDTQFLETFSTNFGRTEALREAVMPYTMRYLRQARMEPEIRQREMADEEEWANAFIELKKYRKWRTDGGL
jgi:hemerythrin-like metal-binding protein